MNTNESTPSDNFDGNMLRQKRRNKGMHQHQVAARLDINQGRISEWENGKPIPPMMQDQLKTFLN